MIKKIITSLLLAFSLLLVPTITFAEDPQPSGLRNPLARFNATPNQQADTTFATAVGRLVSFSLSALAALSLIPIVIGGMYLLSSSGNPEMVKKGRDAITWGVIGLVLGLSSVIIYNFLLQLLIR